MGNFSNILVKLLSLTLATLVIMAIWSTPLSAAIYFDLVIDESRQLLYGSDRNAGKIEIISIDTLSIVDTINVGSQPVGLDISPDGAELAVALNGQSEIVFIDLATLVVTHRLTPQDTLGPNKPFDVVYGRSGRLYSVGNPGSAGLDYVHVFDTVNKIEIGRSTAIMRAAPRLAITNDKNTLYVSQVIFSPQKIYRFDISTDSPVQTAAAPHGPVKVNTLAVKSDSSVVYTSRGQVWSGNLTTLVSDLSLMSYEIEYSGALQKFFITDGSQINEYNANDYSLIKQYSLCGEGGTARINSTGTHLYVSTETGVVSINLSDGTVSCPLSVTAFAGPHGSLDESTPSPQTLISGSTAQFTFTADPGYYVVSINGCGINFKNDDEAITSKTVTTNTIISDCTVIAKFISFNWAMFLPAILEGRCERRINWSAHSHVCCRYSPLTFSVTIEGITKESVANVCGGGSTREDWQGISSGVKTVNWQLDAPGCGFSSGSFTKKLEKGKSYIFHVVLLDNKLRITSVSGDTCLFQDLRSTNPDSISRKSVLTENYIFQNDSGIILDMVTDKFESLCL